ncbi:MAG: shikimate kinase [Candidatus Atribacteria bacterium]|nr:shikimate kinase [Candidatus Atribacteria bacterium]
MIDKNIALIGFMGCGKSTVGKLLAQEQGWNFFDSDELVVRKAGCSIPEIFQRWGEKSFRKYEREVLVEVSAWKSIVLATGGGLPTGEVNWEILHHGFYTVYLKVDFDVLYERIRGDATRPLLKKYGSKEKLRELHTQRLYWYEKAHVIIDATYFSQMEIVKDIIQRAGLSGSGGE